ncbi:hypothetical protein DV451_001361 [Geotrichum candidum]|uniref:SH3 domain-containing protein n=1 Tax=Geotrichum candidum TaxID=1173061 RepID=A0A9P5G9H6_GEOCN|nr:hypothetical protein DV451_001361 [Geotrichum candidum]KAI9213389.1 hypothetical protein DS838_001728 [Geotrichum bryndzae]KAF5109573.1 hypothetical protein DV453_001492 [Geotrichum candidum]KAF5119343.1 hypothetical protein DV452_001762 [Geotrichum candidum]KAF5128774.1 hypothetical protein DV495_002918 [Geotrichum candidum]
MDESYLSSSPSIPEEEIDFQYVYALRTFTATEQGQATALKGDAMILLNDSNSYWWLVRLVKDGTVGFLPAEHVETPSERLARLNKHRNGDVSSASFSVLKKHQDKQTKNKPKKKRKTVSFKQVYISSDEDDDDDVGLVDDIVEFSDFSEAEENQKELSVEREILDRELAAAQDVSSINLVEFICQQPLVGVGVNNGLIANQLTRDVFGKLA